MSSNEIVANANTIAFIQRNHGWSSTGKWKGWKNSVNPQFLLLADNYADDSKYHGKRLDYAYF